MVAALSGIVASLALRTVARHNLSRGVVVLGAISPPKVHA